LDSIVTDPTIDPKALRKALGHFATGVTVVTTRGISGDFAGLTVNSFSSLSLSPPLVMWSIALSAASFTTFETCSHFIVNVLAEDQIQLAERFAQSGGDKFKDLLVRESIAGTPLLDGVAASFVCRVASHYPGGDHSILIGEVLAYEQSERAPLLYVRGRYRKLGAL
jgi:3-hydroxy-9,10-secoandrosta-1,3,5(10)-triene-9,17-dione monooxygenase reductase component